MRENGKSERGKENGYFKNKENRGINLLWLRSNYGVLCLLAAVVSLFPVGCNYIMDGGIVKEWIARVKEIAEGFQAGHLYLFPSSETLAATGVMENAMNSNLCYLIPGLIYRMTDNMVLSYRTYMLLIQAGTFFAATLCFRRIFRQRGGDLAAAFGILLYMTNPYRIYICYDAANLSQATAWMFLPLYMSAIYGLLISNKIAGDIITAALALAGVGYADIVLSLILIAVTILVSIWARKLSPFAATGIGCILLFPGLYRLLQYLFMGGFSELQLPPQTIMPKGYHLGQYFASYAFREGHPGMGIGMMICLLALLWVRFVNREKGDDKDIRNFTCLSLFFTALSFFGFPWDFFQRLGGWAIKLISLIGTPATFWGMAMAVFCIPAAAGIEKINRYENKLAAEAISLIAVLFCVGICVYQCNTLTYTRLPMDIDYIF